MGQVGYRDEKVQASVVAPVLRGAYYMVVYRSKSRGDYRDGKWTAAETGHIALGKIVLRGR
jgi:hypothetical protein